MKNKKIGALILSGVIFATVVAPTISYAKEKFRDKGLKISVLSDTHIFPKSFAGNNGPNFKEYLKGDRKMLLESESILDSAIKKVLDEKPDVLLISGDLTKDSEIESHNILSKKLKILEDKGIEVFVINGNHDINNPDAFKFIPDPNNPENDIKVEVPRASKSDFENIYKDFGYDQAISKHDTSLSYVAKLKRGYRLIAIDTNTYGDDPSMQDTDGYFREGLIEWILNEVKKANDAGDKIIGMMHHGIVEHFDGQATLFDPYLVDGFEEASTKFADAGLNHIFTGHFHGQDIRSKTTDNGNIIYDIMTGSLVTSPSPIRTVEFTKELERFKVKSLRIDKIEGIDDFVNYSDTFLKDGIPDMAVGLLQDILLSFFPEESSMSIKDSLNKFNIEIDESIDISKLTDINEGVDITEPININEKISNTKIREFIIAVTDELKEATLPNTANLNDGQDKKIMDIVTECLISVYNGDEQYTDHMKGITSEISKGETVPRLLAKAISKHRMKLGIIGAIITENFVMNIFNSDSGNGESIGKVFSNYLAVLIENLLTDDNPSDNNLLLYKDNILSSSLVVSAIDTLKDNITLDDRDLILSLRYMYEDLEEFDRSNVTNYSKLLNAESTIDKLDEDLKNKEIAQKVIELIDSIPDNITLTEKDKIINARTEYNKLNVAQKELVTNYNKLVLAEEKLKKLEDNEENKDDDSNTNETTKPNDNSSNSNNTSSTSKPNNTSKNPTTGDTSIPLGILAIISSVSGLLLTFRKKIFK